VQILDVLADPDYEMHRARDLGGFRTMCGVPMLASGKVVGVIVLWRETVEAFDDRTVALVTTFAAQGAIAIQNAQLFHSIEAQTVELEAFNRRLEQRVEEQVEELERVRRLQRFLAPQVADLVLSSGDESFLESHRREITTLVCDLRGFTAFAEAVQPEEVMVVLREYHAGVGEELHRFEATLDRFSGGRVMAYLNDPLPCIDAPSAPSAWRWRCATACGSWPRAGAAQATTCTWRSGSLTGTRRSAASGSRGAGSTAPSAA
jgi:adenylate cyclase